MPLTKTHNKPYLYKGNTYKICFFENKDKNLFLEQCKKLKSSNDIILFNDWGDGIEHKIYLSTIKIKPQNLKPFTKPGDCSLNLYNSIIQNNYSLIKQLKRKPKVYNMDNNLVWGKKDKKCFYLFGMTINRPKTFNETLNKLIIDEVSEIKVIWNELNPYRFCFNGLSSENNFIKSIYSLKNKSILSSDEDRNISLFFDKLF